MDGLIERLKTTGPDRNLDCEIALAAGYRERGGFWRGPDRDNSDPPLASCPLFTASIDAALTLVPVFDGKQRACWWKLEQSGATHGSEKSLYHATIKFFENDSEPPKAWGISDSPAIALCIAALKARNDKHKM